MGKAEFKVPGGKLIRARVEVMNGKVRFVRFTGDFFMTPEEDLEELENRLIGIEADPDVAREAVISYFRAKGTSIVGGKAEDFAHVLAMALRSA
ncbi:MAG: lipoate protein ligase C-terminal domain-containing protein [Candidatus Bathyarchaeia archaeon]|nr:biotin--protein ligase [Candidatus Bathyarchaeota archaeon]